MRSSSKTEDMLIGALLRIPAQAIHRRIIHELNAAGFEELRVPHMAVLQFPGPDGVRPGALAERAGMSKQAMNQLLRSLEHLGYLVRADAPNEGRARIIRLTTADELHIREATRYCGRSSENGALNSGPTVSTSSKNCCCASGRAR